MSDNRASGGNGQGVYGAAKEAIESAAEQVRAAAPGTYEASAKAARYVGDTASEHPFPLLAGAIAIAFFSGWLLPKGGDSRRDWQKQARNWQERGYEMRDRVRAAVPDVSNAADEAGEYLSQGVRENPIAGLLIAAAVGVFLSLLFRSR